MASKAEQDLKQRDNLWHKFRNAMNRGHRDYTYLAKKLENYYLGGGRHWEEDSDKKAELDAAGKPALELNLINSSIRTILGYQTQSRMNIAYQPREQGDTKVAEILTKIALYELDQNKFPWVESQVFEDGLVQQRGYFDIRMDYEEDVRGRIKVEALDPLDVIPDADAKSYDPKDWNYVMVMKWLPLDTIKALYPKEYKKVYETMTATESDWGEGGYDGAERNKFSQPYSGFNYYMTESGDYYIRVLEVQHMKTVRREYFYNIEDGSMEAVPDDMNKKEATAKAKATETELVSKVRKRIRYTICTQDVTLHDDWSSYDHYTIVPYFPMFRRGITMGLVDNLISNQDMMNKVYSQILHIVNTTANSGWIVEENSLSNMDEEDLEVEGASTGLVVVYKRGRQPPSKIEPNSIPSGLKDIFNTSRDLHDQILGVNEAFRGEKTNEVSGQAIQQRVSQTGVGLTSIIDNLFFTRNLVASILLNLIQNFYTEERTFKILSDNVLESDEEVTVNQEVEVDIDEETQEAITEILNDINVGKYDVVISDVPTQVTYLDAQFQQGLEMRKFGINVPDDEMILMSTLTRREEIAKKVSGEASEAQQQQMEIQLKQLQATVDKLVAEAENKEQDTIKKAAEIAQMIAENPAVAPVMGQILQMQGRGEGKQLEAEKAQMELEQQQIQTPQEEAAYQQQLGRF